MSDKRILISGASVAGPTLAYWLNRHGFKATIVEQAPAIREGGQAIDIRGSALEVIDRMGLSEQVKQSTTNMDGMSYVDSSGKKLLSTKEFTYTGGSNTNDDLEIMRSDLARILYDATQSDVEYIFGNSISSVSEGTETVIVTFADGEQREFDLVIGADGAHSAVRALTFGPERQFRRHLGSYMAVFTVSNFLDLNDWQLIHLSPNKTVGVYSTPGNADARAIFGFESPDLGIDHRDTEAQKQLLAKHFADVGWESHRLLEQMWSAPDFHFDAMSHVVVDRWARGRTALVGDAAYCPSPLSGQGTSVALVGAYILAGELAEASDHRTAFAHYERAMRDYVDKNQRLAKVNTGKTQTWAHIKFRLLMLRLTTYAPFKQRIIELAMRNLHRAANAITLKDYHHERQSTDSLSSVRVR